MNQRKSRRWVSYMLSGFWWAVHGAVLAIVGLMPWAHGHAWELPEPAPLSWVVLVVAPTVFAAGAISAWRRRETGVFIGLAAGVVIFSAIRTAFLGSFIFLSIAQPPVRSASQVPSPPAAVTAPPPGGDKLDWQKRSTVTTGRGKILAPEPPRDNAKDGSKPERPTIVTLSSRPAAMLAAASGLEQTKFDVSFSVVVAVAIELVMLVSLARAMDLWPNGDEPQPTQTETLSMALQLFGLMTLVHGLASPSAREAPQRSPREAKADPAAPAPASSNPVVGNGSPAPVPHSTRRPRVPEQDRAHALLQLLQQSHRGGIAEIQVQDDGSLFSTYRRLGALLQCGPGAIKGAVHRLAADGQITLKPGARGTLIRVLCAPAGQADILGSPPPLRTEAPAEGAQSGSSAPA